jgi:polysaccharide biosynthesis transport protein
MLFRRKSSTVAAPAPAIAPMAFDAEPDLRGLGRILWQKKARILGLTLLAGGVAFLIVNAITPRYQSESRLLLEARENVFLRAEADKSGERTTIDPEAVTSQLQLVLSRDLARDVIKKEKLADNPEFDPSNGGLAALRAILGKFGIGRDLSTMSPEERTLEAYYERLNDRHRLQFGQSGPCGPGRQHNCHDLPQHAAGSEAGPDPRCRRVARRRDREDARARG